MSTAPVELHVPFIVPLHVPFFVLLNVAALQTSGFVLIAPSYLVTRIHPAKSMRYE